MRAIPADILNILGSEPTLVLIAQNAQPMIFLLPNGKRITIGRDKTNDLPVDDAACSRRHAEIFSAPDGFYIRDLNSSNGVFVNRVKISNPYHLSHGDRIVIGNLLVYFSHKQATSQPLSPLSGPQLSVHSGPLSTTLTAPAQRNVTVGLA